MTLLYLVHVVKRTRNLSLNIVEYFDQNSSSIPGFIYHSRLEEIDAMFTPKSMSYRIGALDVKLFVIWVFF